MIITFIPAAGRSSRMGGRDKLLETIRGEPILARTARIALEAGLGPVLAGLTCDDNARRKTLEGLDVILVDVPNSEEGMAASLRVGARKALQIGHDRVDENKLTGLMILLPDMPEITADDLKSMYRHHQTNSHTVVRATTASGEVGHPTIFPAHALEDFENLKGDKGAASLVDSNDVETCPLPANRARLDLDTPDDWAKWRAKTGISS